MTNNLKTLQKDLRSFFLLKMLIQKEKIQILKSRNRKFLSQLRTYIKILKEQKLKIINC